MDISGNVTAVPAAGDRVEDAAEKARYHEHDDLDDMLKIPRRRPATTSTTISTPSHGLSPRRPRISSTFSSESALPKEESGRPRPGTAREGNALAGMPNPGTGRHPDGVSAGGPGRVSGLGARQSWHRGSMPPPGDARAQAEQSPEATGCRRHLAAEASTIRLTRSARSAGVRTESPLLMASTAVSKIASAGRVRSHSWSWL